MSGLPVVHPATIPNLAADCRRVLLADYQSIQVAADPKRLVDDRGQHWIEARNLPGGGYWKANASPRIRTAEEISTAVAAAVAEYRRTAELWGVDVDRRRVVGRRW